MLASNVPALNNNKTKNSPSYHLLLYPGKFRSFRRFYRQIVKLRSSSCVYESFLRLWYCCISRIWTRWREKSKHFSSSLSHGTTTVCLEFMVVTLGTRADTKDAKYTSLFIVSLEEVRKIKGEVEHKKDVWTWKKAAHNSVRWNGKTRR